MPSANTMSFVPLGRPFFRHDERAVDEALVPAHLPALAEPGEEGPPEVQQGLIGRPLGEPPVDTAQKAVRAAIVAESQ